MAMPGGDGDANANANANGDGQQTLGPLDYTQDPELHTIWRRKRRPIKLRRNGGAAPHKKV
jgi:hypothetical protein